jgi:hypothetical protein
MTVSKLAEGSGIAARLRMMGEERPFSVGASVIERYALNREARKIRKRHAKGIASLMADQSDELPLGAHNATLSTIATQIGDVSRGIWIFSSKEGMDD